MKKNTDFMDEAIVYLNRIRDTIEEDGYKEFLDILTQSNNGEIDIVSVVARVEHLLKDHENLLIHFKDFMFENDRIKYIQPDRKLALLKVYNTLKQELLDDPAFDNRIGYRLWLDKMMDYNIPGGNLDRGLSVIDSYKMLTGEQEVPDEQIFLLSALGWCIGWAQAYFHMLDDMIDFSRARNGQPCWYRVYKVRMAAANDAILLRNHIARILKTHFRKHAFYVNLVDLFNEVEFHSATGKMIELTGKERDITEYSLPLYRRIALYKTAYYSFYFPVACALLVSGENLDNHVDVKDILLEMGVCLQVQDDYLNAFGNPRIVGETGTDIEDHKCSWLVAKALDICSEEQKIILRENYGKRYSVFVANVKDVYNEINLKGAYDDYQRESYEKLVNSIVAHPTSRIKDVLKYFLAKVYHRGRWRA
ncbi:hypothetical protein ACFE04_012203 [Oxalis oulophora]